MWITFSTYGKQQWTMQALLSISALFLQRNFFLVIVLVSNHQADDFFSGAGALNIFAGRCDIEG